MEKRFYWLYVTVFINVVGFGMIFPILPLFAESFQATSFQIGLLASTFSIVQFIFAPIIGRFSDRFGRKPVLLFSIALTALAYFILGYAPNLLILFVGMAIQGLGGSGVLPAALAYIADITKGHNRSKYISRITGTFALGFMVGPVVGGFLGNISLPLPFYTAAIVGIINLLVIKFFLVETHHTRDERLAIRQGLINVPLLIRSLRSENGVFFVLLFAWALYISNFNLTIPFFTEERYGLGPFGVGIFFSFVGFIAALTQWYMLPVIERKVGDVRVIFYGGILLVIGQLLVPFATNLTLFYLAFTIAVLGSALLRPSTSALLSKKTKEGQGTTMGLAFSFESLGRVIGPLYIGYIMNTFGLSLPFWITSIFLFLALVSFWYIEMKKQ